MEGQRKLESDGGGKYNWSWSPEQGKTDGEKPYLRCQGDERTGGDGERKENIGVDFFLADVDLSAGRRPGLSYIEIEILLFQITSTTWHAIFMYVCHLYVYAEGSLSLLLDFHDPNTWPDTRILSNIV